MKNICLSIITLVFSCLISSCRDQLLEIQQPNTPIENFEVLWKDFNEHYGAFAHKGVNWQNQYAKYRPMIDNKMTDEALFKVLTEMVDILDDNHIYLRPTKETGLKWYSGGILGRVAVEDFNKEVAESYLKEKTVYNLSLDYGLYPDNIGYINIKNFDENITVYHKAMDEILSKLKDTKGIVIELRENGGGEDRVAQYIANRFATEKNFSFSSRVKNGPGPDNFSAPINFYTEPQGEFQYTKPVVLLTNLNVFSTGETFILAMLQNSNVTTIGGITGGALSDAVTRDLPNGWSYRMPIADVRDANGKNLEGIGIAPMIEVKNTQEELTEGHDKALEKALALIQ